MVVLAIETATREASVALLRDGGLVQERRLDPRIGSARTLAPAIAQLLADAQFLPTQLTLIAVSTGPGSFTGLRVGITTAKTLAYALGCGIVGVDTLDAIARQVGDLAGSELHAVIDAQRRELFLAKYERTDPATAAPGSHGSVWRRVDATTIIPVDRWLSQLEPGTIVTGPAMARLQGQISPSTVTAAAECWTPQAATIAHLGLVAWQSGRRDDLLKLMPTYMRPSYAEEGPKSKG